MEPKYQSLGETPGLKSNCRPGLPQRSAGEGLKELGSPVADFSLLPRLWRKHMESGLTAPQVYTAIGWNWYARSRWAYCAFSASVCTTASSTSLVFNGGSPKRCPRRWHSTPRTSHLTVLHPIRLVSISSVQAVWRELVTEGEVR